ncbi:MAG: hypothetical protein HY652_11165 [Acidobacteria bacterium]|nr:hypothetical protein [Acidobacteriota bacterium]
MMAALALGPCDLHALYGFPSDMDKLPGRGRNDFGCQTCHLSKTGGGLNYFGASYLERDFNYDAPVQEEDSDRDGFTNGEELNAYPATNPGDPESFPWRPPSLLRWMLSNAALVLAILAGGLLALRKNDPVP